MAKKQRRPKKVKPIPEEIVKTPVETTTIILPPATREVVPIPELIETKIPALQDRMMRYAYRKPRSCPQCAASPVITRMKRKNYALYRCRACGHQWEITV